MLLVTNINFPELLMQSGFGSTKFSAELAYISMSELMSRYLKYTKSAEIYWNGDTSWVCDILYRYGIKPVDSVNVIQSGMKIVQIVDDNTVLLINIRSMTNNI